MKYKVKAVILTGMVNLVLNVLNPLLIICFCSIKQPLLSNILQCLKAPVTNVLI